MARRRRGRDGGGPRRERCVTAGAGGDRSASGTSRACCWRAARRSPGARSATASSDQIVLYLAPTLIGGRDAPGWLAGAGAPTLGEGAPARPRVRGTPRSGPEGGGRCSPGSLRSSEPWSRATESALVVRGSVTADGRGDRRFDRDRRRLPHGRRAPGGAALLRPLGGDAGADEPRLARSRGRGEPGTTGHARLSPRRPSRAGTRGWCRRGDRRSTPRVRTVSDSRCDSPGSCSATSWRRGRSRSTA